MKPRDGGYVIHVQTVSCVVQGTQGVVGDFVRFEVLEGESNPTVAVHIQVQVVATPNPWTRTRAIHAITPSLWTFEDDRKVY